MISIIADIIGIASGFLSILSFKENKRSKERCSINVNYDININVPAHLSIGNSNLLDGESIILLWILGFFVGIYIYNNYRYWLMIVVAVIVLLITLIVYFFFKSRFCIRALPSSTFWVYIFSVIFTALTIASVATIQKPSFGSVDLFHASQILSIIVATLVLSVLAWRMIAFSRGRTVNLSRLNVAVGACFVSFMLASGLLDTLAEAIQIDL